MSRRWLDIEPLAWEKLERLIEAGNLDAIRYYFELGKGWLLNTEEAANVLGVHQQTIRNWAREGKIKSVRLGTGKNSPLRFDPGDLEEYVRKQKNGLGWEVGAGASGQN